MSLSIQKANFWKRISAYLFDFIIAGMLAVGFAAILSAIFGYNGQHATLQGYYENYQTQYETEYGVDFDITQETYDGFTTEQKENFDAAYEAFSQACNGDERVTQLYMKLFYLSLAIVSIGLLLAILLVQFIVPLFFHNGQTLGKKIFGVAVMRTNCVKVSNFVLFARAVFGQYAIETTFPVALYIMTTFGFLGLIGVITIFLLLALQMGVLAYTRHNACIHDLLADTVVVDMGSQRIFDTEEEMLAYKQEQHVEETAKTDYFGKTIV